jgi:hypothetical protein
MLYGILSILIGVFIYLFLVFKISFTISTVIKIILAIILVFDGLKLVKKVKSEYIGNLIFGIILFLDIFNFYNFNPSFGELILLYIGAQIFSSGLVELFFKGKPFSKNNIIKKETLFDINDKENLNLELSLDWNKLNISSINENSLKLVNEYDKSIFRHNISFDNNNLYFEEKLRINSINIPERAKSFVYIPSDVNKSYLKIDSNVCDLTIDLFDTNSEYLKINSKASKIHLIPSSKRDSNIDINIQVSNLTIEVPNNVFVIINYIGDLTMKELNGFTQKDDSTLVSNNFENSTYTCKINISSEMSKISSFIS